MIFNADNSLSEEFNKSFDSSNFNDSFIQKEEKNSFIQEEKPQKATAVKFWENAVRIAAEFVAPIFIGICVGYVLDKCFDTRIIFMLILAIFGLAAGMLNVYRTARQIEKDIDGSK